MSVENINEAENINKAENINEAKNINISHLHLKVTMCVIKHASIKDICINYM